MDTEHGQSAPHDDGQAQAPGVVPGPPPPPPPPPPPAWPTSSSPGWNAGPGGPSYAQPGQGYGAGYGPGGPYAQPGQGCGPGYGPGGVPWGGPAKPRRRRGMMVAAAGTALALAAGGAAWAAIGHSSAPMTATEIASKTNAGLVDITSTIGYSQATAEGTGMVLTSNGEVLTNNHVIAGATAIKVRDIGNDHTYTAKIVGYSDSNDVAVLQLQGASGLPTISIGSTAGLAPGQAIVALGNAEGRGGTPSVATGHITGLGATITAEDQGSGDLEHLSGMIRTNAPIEPGDSGGPLLNAKGQVIGMDTAASTASGGEAGTTAAVSTQAFAIPISKATQIADQIEAGQASSTVHIGPSAFLGVAVSSQSQQGGFGQASGGATIQGAIEGTPAARAGMTQGDTIDSVGGHQITSTSDLQSVMQQYHPGDKVTVIWSDQFGQSHASSVTLVTGPAG